MDFFLPLVAVGIVAVLSATVYVRAGRRHKRTEAERLAAWGRPMRRETDFARIGGYHFARTERTGPTTALDARTCADLDLDAVFAFLDRTESVPGRQVLYHRLRSTTHTPASLAVFDDLADRFERDVAWRLRSQQTLASLRATSVYWLWTLAFEPVESPPRWALVYPVFAAAILGSLCLIPLAPQLLVVPIAGFVVGGVLRAIFGPFLMPLADSFRDMVQLLAVADRFVAAPELPDEWRRVVKARLDALAPLRGFGRLLGRDAARSGDLASLFVEYLNLLFCLDANAVLFSIGELRRHQEDLHDVFEAVGSLDAALSTASVRAGADLWSKPLFAHDDEPAVFEALAHPLLDNPVANSVTLGPPAGMLVTGANMTGKSTFLRTIGVNVVLAQTIDTVFASAYRAPWMRVASCITPADDLQAGKSYYQAEVETLVAMLADSAENVRLYLFDELFRGTNTLDRIGAASAVLAYLVRRPASGVRSRASAIEERAAADAAVRANTRCLVVAATHDLELVTLLPDYVVTHFADRLTENGLQFDYLLRPGPTTTRNAIALLGVLGAPADVVSEALDRTERLRRKPVVE